MVAILPVPWYNRHCQARKSRKNGTKNQAQCRSVSTYFKDGLRWTVGPEVGDLFFCLWSPGSCSCEGVKRGGLVSDGLSMSTHDPHGNWDGLISKSDAVRRNDGPGGHLPIRRSNETLELKEVRDIGGLYGIGLKIDLDPPHLVQRVSNLKDPEDRSINDKVRQGDALLHIDGEHVELGSMEALEKAILGPKDSTLKLTFVKMPSPGMHAGKSKDVYDVVVKRHVTIREWDETHRWLEVRDDIRDAPLQADIEIVSVMEDLRRCVVDRSNYALDFIREERVAMCSLGMHFAQDMSSDSRDRNLRPNQIQILVPGGPAHISGKLKRGDEIVAVDGVAVDVSNLIKLLRGTDIIGSKCRITAKRSGSTFDIELSRTSAFSVRSMDHFVNLVDILERQLKQRASHDSMLPSVKAVLAHAIETEHTRCSSEALLASRLFHVQSKINGLVNDMQGLCIFSGHPCKASKSLLAIHADLFQRHS